MEEVPSQPREAPEAVAEVVERAWRGEVRRARQAAPDATSSLESRTRAKCKQSPSGGEADPPQKQKQRLLICARLESDNGNHR